MKVWILGSGTLLPDPLRGGPGYWVEVAEDRVLLDCGPGTLGSLARLDRKWSHVTHVIVSHFHTDHVADLAPLLFALKHGIRPPRSGPLTLVGPPGLRDHLEALRQAHGGYVLEPGFPLEIVELDPASTWEAESGGFGIRSFWTRHTDASLAFLLEEAGGVMGFTGDTGPTPGLGHFLKGCDLLVAECSHPDGGEMDNHLTPEGLAALAREVDPDLLVNVHAYPPLDPEEVPDLLVERGYTGRAQAGRDGMVIRISHGNVELEVLGDAV